MYLALKILKFFTVVIYTTLKQKQKQCTKGRIYIYLNYLENFKRYKLYMKK